MLRIKWKLNKNDRKCHDITVSDNIMWEIGSWNVSFEQIYFIGKEGTNHLDKEKSILWRGNT